MLQAAAYAVIAVCRQTFACKSTIFDEELLESSSLPL